MTAGQLMEALEKLVDKEKLSAVIESLGDMCHEKCEHIRTNWPNDGALASTYDDFGSRLWTLAQRAKDAGV